MGCKTAQGVRWDTAALLLSTTFKCTGGAAEALKPAFTSANTVVLRADFYRAGDGNDESFTVDHPIWSKEEADALAKARLQDLALSFITGEAEVAGKADYELGKCVKITANSDKSDDPFNGKYYIMGITHHHTASKSKSDGGYNTILRLARDAQKG